VHYLTVVTLQCCRILTMLYHIGNHYLDFFLSRVLDFFLTWEDERIKEIMVLKVEIFCFFSFWGCLFIKYLSYNQQLWPEHRSRLTAWNKISSVLGVTPSRCGIYGEQSSSRTCSALKYLRFPICVFFLFLERQPPVGQGPLIHEVCRSHITTHHSWYESPGRVIS
jgi:hypothetical protein